MDLHHSDTTTALHVGLPSKSLWKLQLVQDAAAWLLSGDRWNTLLPSCRLFTGCPSVTGLKLRYLRLSHAKSFMALDPCKVLHEKSFMALDTEEVAGRNTDSCWCADREGRLEVGLAALHCTKGKEWGGAREEVPHWEQRTSVT